MRLAGRGFDSNALTHLCSFLSILNYCLQYLIALFLLFSVRFVPAHHVQRSAFCLCFTIKNILTYLYRKTFTITLDLSHIVHTKLDYCNSLFLNIDVTQINRLQVIQNALARAVTKTPKHHHITPVLKKLHWLKIPERIEYKVISLTYNTLQSSQPSCLHQLFTIQPLVQPVPHP